MKRQPCASARLGLLVGAKHAGLLPMEGGQTQMQQCSILGLGLAGRGQFRTRPTVMEFNVAHVFRH